jgi:hypothetical protein
MPPKLSLMVPVEEDGPSAGGGGLAGPSGGGGGAVQGGPGGPGGGDAAMLQASYDFNSSGTVTVFSKSYNPYVFNKDGMTTAAEGGQARARGPRVVRRPSSPTPPSLFASRLRAFAAARLNTSQPSL